MSALCLPIDFPSSLAPEFSEPANTNTLRMDEVECVLDKLRPAMEADGGGVILVSIRDGCVEVRLKGMCLDCPSASLTMRHGIERTLKERVAWIKEVRRVD